jgi:hypothetical protein
MLPEVLQLPAAHRNFLHGVVKERAALRLISFLTVG